MTDTNINSEKIECFEEVDARIELIMEEHNKAVRELYSVKKTCNALLTELGLALGRLQQIGNELEHVNDLSTNTLYPKKEK